MIAASHHLKPRCSRAAINGETRNVPSAARAAIPIGDAKRSDTWRDTGCADWTRGRSRGFPGAAS